MKDRKLDIPAFLTIGLMLGTSTMCLARSATTPSALPFSAALPIPDPESAAASRNRGSVRTIDGPETVVQNTEAPRRRSVPPSEALPFPTNAPSAVDPAAAYNFPNRAPAAVDPISVATPTDLAVVENTCTGFSPSMRDLVSSFWNHYFSYRANADNPPVPVNQVSQIAFGAAARDYRRVLSSVELTRVEKFVRARHQQFLVQVAKLTGGARQTGQRLSPWSWGVFVLSLACPPGVDSAPAARTAQPGSNQITADIEVPTQLR